MGENIPAPVGGVAFDLDEYMTSIDRNPKPVVRRDEIGELPAPRSLATIYDGWVYEPQLMRQDGVWKVAVNSMHGGNSYFAAGNLFNTTNFLLTDRRNSRYAYLW